MLAVFATVGAGVWVAFAASWLVQRPHNVGIAFDNTKGVVSGKLFVQVGPRPATPVSGKVAAVNVSRIGVFPTGVPTAPDGSFSVVVNPGLYEVAGTVMSTTPFYRGGRRTCTIPGRTVRVHAGDHVSVKIQCQTGWP